MCIDLSIVIATHKRPSILQCTLDSFNLLEASSLKWDLWVVDNACDPETEDVVATYAKTLPIKYLVEKKSGKNNALNRAIPEVRGQLIVLTDDDIIANPDWLTQLWEGANRWPDCKVFGGRIVADWPEETPFWGDDHPINQSLFSLHCPSTKERPYGEGDFLPYGPNMAIRREIFDQGYRFNPDIGPTNSTIYRMGSETELLQRLKNDGYTPVFLPEAVVKHQIRPEQLTSIGLSRRNFRIGLSDITPEEKLTTKCFECAPYLWKQLALIQLERLKACISGNQLKLFENTCRFWRIKGKIYAQRHYHGAQKTSFLQKILEAK